MARDERASFDSREISGQRDGAGIAGCTGNRKWGREWRHRVQCRSFNPPGTNWVTGPTLTPFANRSKPWKWYSARGNSRTRNALPPFFFLVLPPPPPSPSLAKRFSEAKIYRGNRLVWKLVLDDRRELYFGREILISYKLNSEFNNSSLLRKILRDKMRKYSLWILIRRIIG